MYVYLCKDTTILFVTSKLHKLYCQTRFFNIPFCIQVKLERLLLLQKRLGKQDLVRPGRELVREGEVELEELGQKEARHLVLLSDCLLCCSFKGLERA